MTQEELYENAIRKDVRGIQVRRELNLTGSDESHFISAMNQVLPVTGLHWVMFIPTIESYFYFLSFILTIFLLMYHKKSRYRKTKRILVTFSKEL